MPNIREYVKRRRARRERHIVVDILAVAAGGTLVEFVHHPTLGGGLTTLALIALVLAEDYANLRREERADAGPEV